ncbi:MAG: S-layer homology domain-containing protein [Clostridia bacterium]|nr:S-layer homology domain-containing protein [Clostridia bacterium]
MRTLKSLLAAVLMVVMIASLSVSAFAVYEEITYDDVDERYGTTLSDVNTVYIKFADALGIVSALKNDTFLPELTITRGEAVKIAYRMLHDDYDELSEYGSTNTDFDENGDEGDISDISLLKPYLAWAMDYQLINSEYVTDKKFQPNANITGEEFITLIAKTVGISTEEDNADAYTAFQDEVLTGSEVDASSETVNREQAAVIVARAMVYDPNGSISEETFVEFKDFDGNPLNSLSTKIYGCTVTDQTIRATRETPLNFEVTEDVLLSNGAQFSVDADLSSCIGFPIRVVYMDKDGSGTITDDEQVITYEIPAPIVVECTLPDITFYGHSYFTASIEGTTYSVYPQSTLYLNGDIWPGDAVYRLSEVVSQYSGTTSVTGANKARPNLKFTFVQTGTTYVDLVLAEEWIPGKVVNVSENYISILNYYNNNLMTYEDKDIAAAGLANPQPGDFVNFYESNGKLHITAGSTVVLDEYGLTDTDILSGKGAEETAATTYVPHYFMSKSGRPVSEMTGPVIAVLDSTRTTYLAVEEVMKTKEAAIQIESLTPAADGMSYNIVARERETGNTVNLTVDTDRISNATGEINPGDWYTYATTAGGKVNLYGVDRLQVTAIESDDYFIVGNEVKYLKTADYTDDSEAPIAGTVTLWLDHNNAVWAAYVN